MTIQIVSMKYTGQHVIADVGEVYQSEEQSKEEGSRPMCLSFTCPYSLVIEDENNEGYNVRFTKWNPFTDEKQYHVGFDLIGMIHAPKQAILEAYKQKVAVDAPKDTQKLAVDPSLQPNFNTEEMNIGFGDPDAELPPAPEFTAETEVNLTPVEDEETVESV